MPFVCLFFARVHAHTHAFAPARPTTDRAKMVANFADTFAKWGIHVERMELVDMLPKAVTYNAMKKQMLAERSRRSDFIIAEGKKSAI